MATLLDIKDLKVEYEKKKEFMHKPEKVYAVNGVSLEIQKGEILAIAGESGCGKSTLAKTLLKLITPKSGEVLYRYKNIFEMNTKATKTYYQNVSMIFQNPYSSLNPKMTIFEIVKEPLDVHSNLRNFSPDLKKLNELKKEEIKEIVINALEQVGMDADCLEKYPHEFSGGQRQRIAIAKALILKPEFVIADEPVSALDVSIQAQIINLLLELKEKHNLTMLFISHDLSVIKYISDRVAVMYMGKIAETGTVNEIFDNPKHPYTKALLSAVPKINEKVNQESILKGDLPDPTEIQCGCPFASRCKECKAECTSSYPEIHYFSDTHSTSCFLYS